MEPSVGTPAFTDVFGRPLTDLRISVTDRCNFRCVYCMPKEVFGPDFQFLPRPELLTFEEITRLGRIFAAHGVTKFRITGGEPLVRKDIERLIAMLSAIPGIEDVALTTNGSLLTLDKAKKLKDAGLKRVTISLDALDEAIFQRMNDVHFPVSRVLAAVEHASEAGLMPVKINVVVKRGMNDAEIVKLAEAFRGTGHVLRFIEFMDVGNANGWRLNDVVPAKEIIDRIQTRWPLEPMEPTQYGEVAKRYRYQDGQGEVGIIASVSQPFCRTCTRARLSPEGQLFTCLFGSHGHDLRALLRGGKSDEEVTAAIRAVWTKREDRYSELRSSNTRPLPPKVEMFHIGG